VDPHLPATVHSARELPQLRALGLYIQYGGEHCRWDHVEHSMGGIQLWKMAKVGEDMASVAGDDSAVGGSGDEHGGAGFCAVEVDD